MASQGRYCVVFHSSTVGKKSHLVDRFKKRKDAEREMRTRNRGAGYGGFYNTHECARLGHEFRNEIGLDGTRKRKRK